MAVEIVDWINDYGGNSSVQWKSSWILTYDATTGAGGGCGWGIEVGYCHIPIKNYRAIFRHASAFDTSVIPVDASITAVKLSGTIGWNGVGLDQADYAQYGIGSYLRFVRVPNFPTICPGSGKAGEIHSCLRNCDIEVANRLHLLKLAYGETFDIEVEFNSVGIATIEKSGITIIGVRSVSDTPTEPPANTASGCTLRDKKLHITYDTGEELIVVTIAATAVTKNSLTMNGEITQGAATKRGFDWGESSDALINEWYEEGTYGIGEFSHDLTDLTPGQNFCHRAKAGI